MRPSEELDTPPPPAFQFTHPGKGATWARFSVPKSSEGFNSRTLGRVRHTWTHRQTSAERVSIHAPWEGCDSLCTRLVRSKDRFNSRTLGRVRRREAPAVTPASSFNSRTLGRVRLLGIKSRGALNSSFNSRTLGRVRHLPTWVRYPASSFQFTHPGKGATPVFWICWAMVLFQFTHPGKGATINVC